MEAIIYVIIFITGAFFGSFYTLATYRIPRNQDITHSRSYCPNCKHKLGFLDLFPILSYIFLGGKCRYCKKKISPRYLILEVLSGITFLALFYLMKIDIYNISITSLCEYAFFALYLSFIFITAGIDKENSKIEKSVSVYGIAISLMYIVYLYIVEKANIYRYAIYIMSYLIVLIFDTINLKKYAKEKYLTGLLLTLITMEVFTGEIVTGISVAITLLIICIWALIQKFKLTKDKERIIDNFKMGYCLCIFNIIAMLSILIYTIII